MTPAELWGATCITEHDVMISTNSTQRLVTSCNANPMQQYYVSLFNYQSSQSRRFISCVAEPAARAARRCLCASFLAACCKTCASQCLDSDCVIAAIMQTSLSSHANCKLRNKSRAPFGKCYPVIAVLMNLIHCIDTLTMKRSRSMYYSY